MELHRLSIMLTIAGTIGYHICNKFVNPAVHASASLVATYAVALAASSFLFWLGGGQAGFLQELSRLNWASYVLGLAVVLIEAGFLLAYRAGWILGNAQLSSTVAATLLLLPIGILFFHERVSMVNAIGVVLSIAGIVLMTHR
jgi:uncharacterized membrane protein